MAIETPFSKLQALVVDDAPTQLATMRGQLQMLGIGKVDGATGPDDALRLAKGGRHNLIMCDYSLGHKTDGQQLFEYLRDNDVLAPDCIFFMITAENSYASVAAASEHKPDGYLLKPITAADIQERLKAAMERRKAFEAVNAALARKDLARALDATEAMLAKKDRWFMQALQNKGHILLQLGRHADARAVYQLALQNKPGLVWAQLGLARGYKAGNLFEEAKNLAQEIINSPEGQKNLAAYDVMAEALEAQGDAKGAQWVLRDAATAVPSAKRNRLLAESAYRNGELEEAMEAMTKVTKATSGAITAQPQDTFTLAQAMIDAGQHTQAMGVLDQAQGRFTNSPQLESVTLALRAQALTAGGDTAGAAKAVARARETMRGAKADFATVALAKAELVAGNEEAGLKLLGAAVSSDHENPRVKQLVRNALRTTGHEAKMDTLVEAAAAGLQTKVTDAKSLFRDSRIDEALAAIEQALKDYPDNTGVLFQAAQMSCMALRLKKQMNHALVERVRLYLNRLEKLMPNNDRVTQMQRYFRETLATLTEPTAVA
jgi:CheY-like chemotaxis protein/outer membrane protein assembly factor BamD (BamD/ComL family)